MIDGDPMVVAVRRETLCKALGIAAVIDAAAVIASFNAVVRVADGTGIPLETEKAALTEDLRADLRLDALHGGP